MPKNGSIARPVPQQERFAAPVRQKELPGVPKQYLDESQPSHDEGLANVVQQVRISDRKAA